MKLFVHIEMHDSERLQDDEVHCLDFKKYDEMVYLNAQFTFKSINKLYQKVNKVIHPK